MESLKKLQELQKEYIRLLELYPHGGEMAAENYRNTRILFSEMNSEIKRLEVEIKKLKKKLDDFGIVYE